MKSTRVAAIIPARMRSTRFPGKPVLKVRGLPMIEHVRRRALLCRRFSEVVVATCDRDIADVVESFGGRCLMTSAAHEAATDRVAEAVEQLDCTHVVNVQGDEILALPDELGEMVKMMETEPDVAAWNAVARLTHAAELSDHAVVKCVLSVSHRVVFCSRDFSGLSGAVGGGFEPLRTVLGILGYRRDFLEAYRTMARTPMERVEAIDQWRIIEHDVTLRSVEFHRGYPGINEPREVAVVERYLQDDPVQRGILQEIMGERFAMTATGRV